jgi:hypothetical protein
MKWLTVDALLLCQHQLGLVTLIPSQTLVTIQGRPVLVEPDPETRPIVGCPNYGPTIKPCTSTLPVQHGYSQFLRIQGRRICLDTVTGLTDGTPPGSVPYQVQQPGQQLVDQSL